MQLRTRYAHNVELCNNAFYERCEASKFGNKITNGSLRTIVPKHFVEVYNRACEHIAFQNKQKTLICGDCGKLIKEVKTNRNGEVVCPHCGKRLKPMVNRKWSYKQAYYIMAIDQARGFQILRYYLLYTYFHKCRVVRLNPIEVFRVYIDENGQRAVCAKLRNSFCSYRDQWRYDSDICLRQVNQQWSYTPYDVHAWANLRARRLSKKSKLAKLNVPDKDFPSATTICKIFRDYRFETIWKAGMYEMAYRLDEETMDTLWPALKICLRNHYLPADASDYIDYVQQLIRLGKDTHNAHYVCPCDFAAAHTRTTEAVRKVLDKEKYEKEKERMALAEEKYAQRILPFLSLNIANNHFRIAVLPTVQSFYEEGQSMHHCVYSNRYYEREDSLILSCRDKQNHRLATIEIGLPQGNIRQVRAACNQVPEQYDSIVQLLTQQRNQIKQLSAAMA